MEGQRKEGKRGRKNCSKFLVRSLVVVDAAIAE